MLTKLLQERIVYLGDDFNQEIATVVVMQLQALAVDLRPASLYVNSNGGSLSAALAIYEAMQDLTYPLATVALGRAEYAAALLVAAGTPGHRLAVPEARFVLGPPTVDGSGLDFQAYLKAVQVSCDTLTGLMAIHTGQHPQTLAQPAQLSADEALRLGLIDRILPKSAKVSKNS